jgi:5-(carboxyamino)imidazole ribonucleotide synthase
MRRRVIRPGGTIGILGSGQLGRMLTLAARAMGYRVHVFSPETDSPAGQVADEEVVADYADLDAVRAFARAVDVVTFEFENISAAATAAADELVPVRPGGWVLHTSQQRLREKTFLRDAGLPVAPFAAVRSLADLQQALSSIGCPAVLKSAAWGYDGKGQARVDTPKQAVSAWESLGRCECILEAFVAFEREVSVVMARGSDGACSHFGVIENRHANHVLDVSVAPADVPARAQHEAVALTRSIVERLDVVGVLCVEFFVNQDGSLLVNELAPRPHNSGHFSIDACMTSQFEQQLRAVCGLPLGAPTQLRPAAMANLLGDLWEAGEPDWPAALALPGVKLHLYGKTEPRAGRKMGHVTALADTTTEATRLVLTARDALARRKN